MERSISLFSFIFCVTLSSTYAAIQINPVADAYVVGGTDADTNFGDNANLLVKNVNPPNTATRKPYLRFDLSTFDNSFEEASLSFVVQSNNNGTVGTTTSFEVAVYGLNDDEAGQDWAENAITWNNAPGNVVTSGSAFIESESTFLGNLSVTTSDGVGATVTIATTALSSFLTADTDDLVTFMLARTDDEIGENLTFWSKDSTAAPYLTLVPEPSAFAALVGLLALGFVGLRRRVS